VTLTDTNLGFSNYPVRVVAIEEDDTALLTFTCEELVISGARKASLLRGTASPRASH
jgi:hypothetical protein